METLPWRILAAAIVGAAGPVAATLAFVVLAPTLVTLLTPGPAGDTPNILGMIIGVLFGLALSLALASFVLVSTTVLALWATGCPRLGWASVACIALTQLWTKVMLHDGADVDLRTAVVGLGLALAAVRFAFDYATPGPATAH